MQMSLFWLLNLILHSSILESIRDQKRVTKPPKRYGFEDMAAYALHAAEEIDSNEPATYQEAINHPEAENWLLAMKEEMESLYKN